jgi:hypothetical protein
MLNIEFIRHEFKKEGYILLSEEYVNNSQKLEYVCPKGHLHSVTWGHWNTSKVRCPYCSKNIKYNIDFARKQFIKIGYQLLEVEYVSSKSNMKYKCDKGHIGYMSLYSIMKGHRCSICMNNKKLDLKYIKDFLKKEKYILLTRKYKNNKQKLKYRCPYGHIHYMRFDSWVSGKRCPTCKSIDTSIRMLGDKHWNWQGGIACEPYCSVWLDKEFKKSILERDNYQCQNPDCWGTSIRLTGHHIDYDKKNCDPSNIITLCNSCNSRANINRKCWTKFYQSIRTRNDESKNKKIT